jgi:hypothetical protein
MYYFQLTEHTPFRLPFPALRLAALSLHHQARRGPRRLPECAHHNPFGMAGTKKSA